MYPGPDKGHLTTIKEILLPRTWVCLLVGVEPKDTTKAKIRKKKDLLLFAASKEHTGDLPQSSVSLNSKVGEDLS